MVRFTEADLAKTAAGRRALERDKKIQQAGFKKMAAAVDREVVDRIVRAGNGEIEAILELQLLEAGLSRTPQFQYRAIPSRKFRLDVAFPPTNGYVRAIGFEVQGMVHRIKAQFKRDAERHNLLTRWGWTMYYVTGDMVRSGDALKLVKEIIT